VSSAAPFSWKAFLLHYKDWARRFLRFLPNVFVSDNRLTNASVLFLVAEEFLNGCNASSRAFEAVGFNATVMPKVAADAIANSSVTMVRSDLGWAGLCKVLVVANYLEPADLNGLPANDLVTLRCALCGVDCAFLLSFACHCNRKILIERYLRKGSERIALDMLKGVTLSFNLAPRISTWFETNHTRPI